MTYLFTDAELAAMAERIRQRQVKQQAPTPPPPTLPPGFTYKPRTPEQWEKRINQSWQSNRSFRPRRGVANFEPLKESKSKSRLPAITGSTPCVCGHCRDSHEYPLPAHPPLPATLSTRCVVNTGCECPAFCPTDRKPTIPRAPVGPYTPCKSCGHGRNQHCTKHKPGAVARLKSPSDVAYKILRKPDGTSYGCKHFSLTDSACQCNSTGCSATPDGQNFCGCEKFVNSSLTPKKRVVTQKSRATVSQDASPAVAVTFGTSETVPAKPRKSRKKKTTAFVAGTGEMFPPASVNP
jgi:hypothetical protein